MFILAPQIVISSLTIALFQSPWAESRVTGAVGFFHTEEYRGEFLRKHWTPPSEPRRLVCVQTPPLVRALSFLRWFGHPPQPDLKASTGMLLATSEDAESQFDWGQRFEKGQGVSQDDVSAAECYLKAAEQGHSAAQFSLGLMYGRGRGVLRNEASAQQWLRRAAEQGHPGAQYHLGVHLYQDSKRLPQTLACEARIEGYKYVQLAVRQRYRGADSALEFIALGISRQEVAEGDLRATGFIECPARPVAPLPDPAGRFRQAEMKSNLI